MTNYFLRCLCSSNRFKLLIAFCLCSLFFVDVNAQELTVSGVMSDESRLPIPASIIVRSITTSAATDFEGNQTLSYVVSNSVLGFCYLGFVSQDISVNGRFAAGAVGKLSTP